MRELTQKEVENVGGASAASDLAAWLASGAALGVADYGARVTIAGVGSLSGAVLGFTMGGLSGGGLALATPNTAQDCGSG